MWGMNKLPLEKRVQILTMLVEGSSLRSISRVAGVSINTVTKLLVDAGTVCATFHDEMVRHVAATRVQCDEIWSFCYAKQKNVKGAKAAPANAGDVWTWTGLDAASKLVVSWMAGGRDSDYAMMFMDDLRSRLANGVRLTRDGHKAYLEAVEGAFGADVDYAMLVKLYGESPEAEKRYSLPIIGISGGGASGAASTPCAGSRAPGSVLPRLDFGSGKVSRESPIVKYVSAAADESLGRGNNIR